MVILHDHHLNRCNLYHHQGHYQGHYQGHHSSSSLSSELLLHGCYHCHLYKWEPFLSWDIFKECILSVGDNENKYLEEINPLLFPRLAQVHILIIICHWLQFKAFSPVYCCGDCPWYGSSRKLAWRGRGQLHRSQKLSNKKSTIHNRLPEVI